MIIKSILLIVFASNAVISAYDAGQVKQGKQIIRNYNYLILNMISSIAFFFGAYFGWDI